jgi:hypothetical protein
MNIQDEIEKLKDRDTPIIKLSDGSEERYGFIRREKDYVVFYTIEYLKLDMSLRQTLAEETEESLINKGYIKMIPKESIKGIFSFQKR